MDGYTYTMETQYGRFVLDVPPMGGPDGRELQKAYIAQRVMDWTSQKAADAKAHDEKRKSEGWAW